ncbi:hypothetical protein [Actinomyces bovis]|uniref:hypothetical protein n=1 Tax=Actinomyces bovis TaxID=1658 RepID=UPI000F839797|nr:hypothetical protein [Actinomyces bovis]
MSTPNPANPADLAEAKATRSCEVAADALLRAQMAALRAAADAHTVEAAPTVPAQAERQVSATDSADAVGSETDCRRALAAAQTAYEAAREELDKAEESKAGAEAAVLQARHERDLAAAICKALECDGRQAVARAETALAAAEKVTDACMLEVVPQAGVGQADAQDRAAKASDSAADSQIGSAAAASEASGPAVAKAPQLPAPSQPNTSWSALIQALAAEGWARELRERLSQDSALGHAQELENQAQETLQDACVATAAASARFEAAKVYANLARRAVQAAAQRRAAPMGPAADAPALLAASRLQLAQALGTHRYDQVEASALDLLVANLSGVDHQAALVKGFNDARFPLLVCAYARAQAHLDAAIKARANAAARGLSTTPATAVVSHVDRHRNGAMAGKYRLLKPGSSAAGSLAARPAGRRRGKHAG